MANNSKSKIMLKMAKNSKSKIMQISNQQFLELVRERPVLWQKSNPDFQNRDLRHALLTEVAKIAGITVTECAKKLKGFKDTMRAQVARLPKTKSGIPDFSATDRISWPFFKTMLYMKGEFLGRKSGRHNSGEESSETTNNSHKHDASIEDQVKNEVDENLGEMVLPVPISMQEDASTDEAEEIPVSVSFNAGSSSSWQNSSYDAACHSNSNQQGSKRPHIVEGRSGSEYKHRKIAVQDEYDIFAADIANDLRKIDNPIQLMQTKAAIRRAVEDAVLSELCAITSEEN